MAEDKITAAKNIQDIETIIGDLLLTKQQIDEKLAATRTNLLTTNSQLIQAGEQLADPSKSYSEKIQMFGRAYNAIVKPIQDLDGDYRNLVSTVALIARARNKKIQILEFTLKESSEVTDQIGKNLIPLQLPEHSSTQVEGGSRRRRRHKGRRTRR